MVLRCPNMYIYLVNLTMAMTYICAIVNVFIYSVFDGYSPMLYCHPGIIYSEIKSYY